MAKTTRPLTRCLFLLLLSSLLGISANPTPLSAAPASQGIPDVRFGVIEAYDAPAQASALGAGWERITFEWNQIQPNGSHEWVEFPVADAVLDAERGAGRELVGLLVTTPGWATDWGRGAGVPQGLYLPASDPQNTWATFVRTMVSRHQGRIRHWIIWNEPDIWDTHFQSWGGSVEDFVQLMRVAYVVAHEVNPNVVIHLPAITHWWDANYGRELFMRRFLQALTSDPLAAEHNHYFDAFTLHIYFNPDTVYNLSRFYYGLLAEHGIYKPLWIVETNAAPSDDPAWPVPAPQFQITQEDQAAFVIQGFAMALAAGAQRVAFYKLADLSSDTANPEPFGLIRLDGSRRPAFTAYQTASSYLAGFQSATLDRRDDAAVVTVQRAAGWTTVLWARGPQAVTVQVPAHAASARLIDWRGSARTLSAQAGQYTLTLPGSPCTQPADPCLIGGAPYLLVEGSVPAGPAPAPVQATATPQLSNPVASLTPTATAPAMPTATSTATRTPVPTRTPRPTLTPSVTPTPTATATPTPTATSTATATALPASPTLQATAASAPQESRAVPWPGLVLVMVALVGWGIFRGRAHQGG